MTFQFLPASLYAYMLGANLLALKNWCGAAFLMEHIVQTSSFRRRPESSGFRGDESSGSKFFFARNTTLGNH